PDQPGITILTVNAPAAPYGACTMTVDLAFAADRPARVSTATYCDEGGAQTKTVTCPSAAAGKEATGVDDSPPAGPSSAPRRWPETRSASYVACDRAPTATTSRPRPTTTRNSKACASPATCRSRHAKATRRREPTRGPDGSG